MLKTGRFKFLFGFVFGALIFGSVSAIAAGIIATPSPNSISVNGSEVKIETYLINGRNYMQLRDIADAVDFSVVWDGFNNRVLINTARGYDPNENIAVPPPYFEPDETNYPVETSYSETIIIPNPYGVHEKDLEIWNDMDYELFENELEVIRLINEERLSAGLGSVKINIELCKVARIKAIEMAELDYFSHDSPNYGSHTEMVRRFGINCIYAGENAGRYGGTNPKAPVYNWMESEPHRNNILNPKHTEIGIGVGERDGLGYWSLFMMY